MTTTAVAANVQARTGRTALLPYAAATTVVAVLVNTALATALAAVVDASEDFTPLTAPAVAAATVVGVLLGASVCLAARRLAPRPRALALGLLALGTLLSLGGPLSLLAATPQEQPGVSVASALALLPLHLLVGLAVALGVASRLPRRR
jgi:hypothetical protein